MEIIEVIEKIELCLTNGGASKDLITNAENALDCVFSDEYRTYLSRFGSVSYVGHELTGISSSPAIDVVYVTKAVRTVNPTIPESWYIIENTHIDDLVFWQAEDGKIYQSIMDSRPKYVCESLARYIQNSLSGE